MATTGAATSFLTPNFSGMLFNTGNTKTPFSAVIGGKMKRTNHVSFVTGLEYATEGGEQPNISETESLTAPDPTYINRDQKINVTQIFHESVAISYAKQSNMGTLEGVNIAGQKANPPDELDFQIAAKMAKIARDIEYTFIQGRYNAAVADTEVNKTRGMIQAIPAGNAHNLEGEALRVWDIAELMKTIYEKNAPANNLILWVDPVSLFQLNADAEMNGNTIVPATRTVNGISISTLLTPLGEVGVYLGEFLPSGTVMLFNPGVISPVEQPTPEKGNFFLEQLAKTGAGEKYQIFGQIGLDHGMGWYHGKITGISTRFEKPKQGKKIYTTEPLPVAEVLPQLDKVKLSTTVPVVIGTATEELELEYIGTPLPTPTIAKQWQKASSANGMYSDIDGKTEDTYTPVLADANAYIRCKVTASGTAIGTKYSNGRKVYPALDAVTITGDPNEEEDLTANVTYVGTPEKEPTIKYQWSVSENDSDFTDIDGEIGEVFTVPENYEGKYVKVTVTVSGSAYGTETSSSTEIVGK